MLQTQGPWARTLLQHVFRFSIVKKGSQIIRVLNDDSNAAVLTTLAGSN
jgi:hypothetical protein